MDVISDKNTPGISKSKPIAVPRLIKNNSCTEFFLNNNLFDPNKSSPPDHWNKRLISRIGNSYEIRKLFMDNQQSV
jgi:hypothetical protein